jgi:hypothetical protein
MKNKQSAFLSKQDTSMTTGIFEAFLDQLEKEAKLVVKLYHSRKKNDQQKAVERFLGLYNFPHRVLECAGGRCLNKGTWSGIVKEWCVYYVVEAFRGKNGKFKVRNNCRVDKKGWAPKCKRDYASFDVVVIKCKDKCEFVLDGEQKQKKKKIRVGACAAVFEVKVNSDDPKPNFNKLLNAKRKPRMFFIAGKNGFPKSKNSGQDAGLNFIFYRSSSGKASDSKTRKANLVTAKLLLGEIDGIFKR